MFSSHARGQSINEYATNAPDDVPECSRMHPVPDESNPDFHDSISLKVHNNAVC